jgi:hypothetical protein
MKLYTPESTELIDVTSVTPHENGIEIEGTIMGTMPMRAVLRASELRKGMRFLRRGLVWTLVTMLFRRD